MDNAVRNSVGPWWSPSDRHAICDRVSQVSTVHYAELALRLTLIDRWLAQYKSRNAASHALMKLRNLSEGHPYLEEELAHIMVVANDIREASGSGGLIPQWKKLRIPSNRKRVFLGITVFVFMQFAGSNAIK